MNSKYLTTVNLDPFLRGAIGVDSYVAEMLNRCENANTGNYPPYNIIQIDDDHYEIELAVAGFNKDAIEISVENGYLVVADCKVVDEIFAHPDEEGKNYIHRGISSRSFERTWQLADHVEVTSATMENGILRVELERKVPEALKPKQIEIK